VAADFIDRDELQKVKATLAVSLMEEDR